MTSAERCEIADEEGTDLGGVRAVSFEDSNPRDLPKIGSLMQTGMLWNECGNRNVKRNARKSQIKRSRK